MKWIVLYRHTGTNGSNLKLARRVARKIQGAQRIGQCVVVDCEDVKVSSEFLRIIADGAKPDKVRFAGLPIADQRPNDSAPPEP